MSHNGCQRKNVRTMKPLARLACLGLVFVVGRWLISYSGAGGGGWSVAAWWNECSFWSRLGLVCAGLCVIANATLELLEPSAVRNAVRRLRWLFALVIVFVGLTVIAASGPGARRLSIDGVTVRAGGLWVFMATMAVLLSMGMFGNEAAMRSRRPSLGIMTGALRVSAVAALVVSGFEGFEFTTGWGLEPGSIGPGLVAGVFGIAAAVLALLTIMVGAVASCLGPRIGPSAPNNQTVGAP